MINFHNLAHRQFEKTAPFTTWDCSNEEVLNRISIAIIEGSWRAGDVEGSMIVTISPDNIFTPVVDLTVGQKLFGVYEPRRGTTYPMKTIKAEPLDGQVKIPAKSCEAIVYLIDDIYNVVSINGSPEEFGTPINLNTLLRNYFMVGKEQAHGTNLTWSEMEEKVKEAFLYWEGKAMLGLKNE